ncbi:activating signal cointegrator 1 isoform X2 [Ictidomys tridecemlineatus]|uniref:Activating signal cointegrator 1 n=3 Tax=Ictidomys tridecemlineatus TaxID=43179 RepID=A0A287CVG3_ICTTR|nr:activating signal cointegrator 1 isoform X1 [Ictidomys tridecemlineatus]KAG3262045.1 thyroid hormone receptor interactor 4, transcript variant X1 [Ictidomys tridecemlineatus]
MAVAGAVSREPLVLWCTQQLRKTFGLDVSEEILQYVLSIESAEEIREYVTDLLQGNEGKKGQFIDNLITKWQKNDQELLSDPLQQCFKKDESFDMHKSGDQLKRGRRKGRNKQEVPAFAEHDTTIEVKTPFDLAKAQENSSSVKKKTKFVNLYTREGQDKLAVLLPGRHPCDCLGQKHKLINNCLICGRIVCEQEGSGPCLFCGSLVCTHEEQDILQRDSNKSQKLLKKLMSGMENSGKVDISTKDLLPHQESRIKSGLEKAIKHKDKLLEFDRTSIRRTQVIDDESDYFASDSNQWLSKIERETLQKREEELRELRHASRLSKKVTIDFAGRKILEEENPLAEYHSRLDETIQAIANGTLNQPLDKMDRSSEEPLGVLVNPNLYQSPPKWVDHTGAASQKKAFHSAGLGLEFNLYQHQLRIQDQEFQEGFDGGWCLSIHQPWASLLVRGIKRVEGRSWYTPHRGRLWIAATGKKPSPQEVSELQATYRLLRGKDVEFPNDYPSGCLLGCVDLVDCLSQKQFKEQFPDISQESDSPFVFICKNPQEMIVKFPIKGNPKIWKLDSKIHQGAKKGLMKQNKAV